MCVCVRCFCSVIFKSLMTLERVIRMKFVLIASLSEMKDLRGLDIVLTAFSFAMKQGLGAQVGWKPHMKKQYISHHSLAQTE